MQVEHDGTFPSHLLLRFRHGMHADDTAFRFPPFPSPASLPSDANDSLLGRMGLGGIAAFQPCELSEFM